MLAVEIHQVGGLMPTQTPMQVGYIVRLTRLEHRLAALQSIIFRIIFELNAWQLDEFLLAVRDEAALGDFQGAGAHLIQRKRRVGLDGLSGQQVIIGIILSDLPLFRDIVLLFLSFVAALSALFIDKRGIKLLFIHYYHTIIRVESSA